MSQLVLLAAADEEVENQPDQRQEQHDENPEDLHRERLVALDDINNSNDPKDQVEQAEQAVRVVWHVKTYAVNNHLHKVWLRPAWHGSLREQRRAMSGVRDDALGEGVVSGVVREVAE